jgi:hypothetical protein
MKKSVALAVAATLVVAAACGNDVHSTTSTSGGSIPKSDLLVDSSTAEARIEALREQLQTRASSRSCPPGYAAVTAKPTLLNAVATGFEKVDDTHFRPVLPANAKSTVTKPASVILPMRASDAVSLEDDTTHTNVKFALRGASDATASVAKGMVVYPGALNGADVVHRVHAEGTEDYVVFESKPALEELAYDVDVSRVAGLRLVSNTLEFLDSDGSPRLRVAPPYVVDARGLRINASLSVTGCAYDVNPAGPRRRAVIASASPSCEVHVAWTGNSYPAMVDPGWTTTGSMAAARELNPATLLSTGKVLVVGGLSTSGILASAELYDPAAGTFSATGSMTTPRLAHTATLLASGKVLVAGGASGGAIASAEIYDPAAGTFSMTGSMATARESHTATLLVSGKVLVAGGVDPTMDTSLAGAELFDPTAGTFSATGAMTTARASQTATSLASGKVLVAGGTTAVSTVTASADLYDPTAGTFSATGAMTATRQSHTATLLASGKVLVTGGGSTGGTSVVSSAELYDPTAGTFSTTGSMATGRYYHTATLLASGKVLVAGGDNGGSYLASAELFDPTADTFSATIGTLATARAHQTATALVSGIVLITGGQNGSDSLASAEVYDPNDFAVAAKCTSNLDCDTNFCVDGVCCNSACTDQCEACDVSGHAGTCTPAAGSPHGARSKCAANSLCTATCDGTNTKACTYAPSKCASTCANGSENDSLCDTTGSCVAQSTSRSCNNLVCADTKSCKTTCASNADCLTGFTCGNDGTCVVGGVCTDAHSSKGADGTVTDCTPYKCGSSGTCPNTCTSVADCVAPSACDPSGHCVAAASSNSGGCNGSGSNESPADAAWIFALAAAYLTVSLRRSRNARAK